MNTNVKFRSMKTIDVENNTVSIHYGPVDSKDTPSHSFNVNELPADIQAKLAVFGLGHVIGDATASIESVEANIPVIMQEREAKFSALKKGDWRKGGSRTTKAEREFSWGCMAIAQVYSERKGTEITAEAIAEKFGDSTNQQYKALVKKDLIKARIAQVMADALNETASDDLEDLDV